MAINLREFKNRALQGDSRIRLSGKAGTDAAPALSSHKGSLGGRVVEWLRGNKQSRMQENKAVTTVFLDAIRKSFGDVGEQAVLKQLKVDDGKPLKSSKVQVLVGLAQQAHDKATERQRQIDTTAIASLNDLFTPDKPFNVYALASGFFDALGHPHLAASMNEQLSRADSEVSQNINRAVHDTITRNWPKDRTELSASDRDQMDRLIQSTVIRTLLKGDCGLLALDGEPTRQSLMRQPVITVPTPGGSCAIDTLDVLDAALSSRRLEPGQRAALVRALIDTAAELAGWTAPADGEPGRIEQSADLEQADRLLGLVFDKHPSLLAQADASAPTHPVASKALALRRDLQLTMATERDADGNLITDAQAVESAIDTECARLALRPGEPDFRMLDGIQARACRALGCPGNLDGSAAANRRFLQQLRERAAALKDNPGLEQLGFISSGMRQITAQMLERAVEAAGPAPDSLGDDFRFEAVSLGSTSRAEASLYSDIEFGFVLPQALTDEQVETARHYLGTVSTLVRMQVKALGESGELGLPKKVHWDEAWNTPAEDREAFIGRPSDLVASSFEVAGDEPAEANRFTMFANAEWLFSPPNAHGTRAGTTDLTAALHRQGRQQFAASSREGGPSNARVLGTWLLKEGLDILKTDASDIRPSHLLARITDHTTDDVSIDVKRLCRLPMMLAQGLCLVNGIHQEDESSAPAGGDGGAGAFVHSTHMRAEALVRAGVLDRQQGDNLIRAVDLLGAVRTAAHVAHDRAEDEVRLKGNDDLFEAIRLLAPLEAALGAALRDGKLRFPRSPGKISSEPHTY